MPSHKVVKIFTMPSLKRVIDVWNHFGHDVTVTIWLVLYSYMLSSQIWKCPNFNLYMVVFFPNTLLLCNCLVVQLNFSFVLLLSILLIIIYDVIIITIVLIVLCNVLYTKDHDMNRGRPLYLSEERYAALTYLVWTFSKDTHISL